MEILKKIRTPGIGEKLILEDNIFVERLLPAATVRKLTDEEMAVYRAPFPMPESRIPNWRFPNELPIEAEPTDVKAILLEAHRALATSTYPKLLFAGDPGSFVSPEFGKSFAEDLIHCEFVQLPSDKQCRE